MLLEHNANVNEKREDGATTLFQALQNSHVDVCTVLIKNNAIINEKPKNNQTTLFVVAHSGHSDLCTVLLKHNANVNENGKMVRHRYSRRHGMTMKLYMYRVIRKQSKYQGTKTR